MQSNKKKIFFFFIMALSACSGMEHSENKDVRKKNRVGEPIYRKDDEVTILLQDPPLKPRDPYPWES